MLPAVLGPQSLKLPGVNARTTGETTGVVRSGRNRNVTGNDWAATGPRYRDEIVATLEARGYTGFGAGIEVERVVTPADWAAMGLAEGAPFASSHTFLQTGPFRPPTLPRRGPENVVFTGSGTQPGVGVPMVLLSGRLAAERITGRDPGYRSRAWR